MKFSIPQSSLNQLLYLCHAIVEKKNTMPILANVRLTAEEGKLTVAVTDLEVSLIGEIEANVESPGSITIDAKVLYEIVKELPDAEIQAKLSEKQRLDLFCGQARFKIIGTASEEYPTIAGTQLKKPISVDAGKFHEMLNKTAFAVSNDETRYNINGVFVETLEGPLGPGQQCLRFVATDGHRMAMIDRPAEGFSIDQAVIIPRKGIQELKRVLEGNEGSARVSVDDGFFTVESGNVILGVRLVDGHFPDYRKVIPLEHTTLITLDRLELLSAVKRVALVTTDKTKTIRCRVDQGSLIISSSSPEYGEAVETVALKQDGEDVTVGFSARYIIDLLGAMSASESVQVKLSGEEGPGIFSGVGDELYSCLVMPMRFE